MKIHKPPKPQLGPVDHIAIAVHNLAEAVDYYQNTLEFEALATPEDIVANGIRWFALGDGRALHLIEVKGVTAPPRAHIAIQVEDNDAWRAYLEDKGVRLVEPTVELYAAKRFFLQDPSGNLIELVEWLTD